MALHPVVQSVTARIIARSKPSRGAYLAHLEAARIQGVQRGALSCTNLAHGFAAFPADIAPAPPREWIERAFNLRRHTIMPSGGHFAALEEPALLVEDTRLWRL